MHILVAFQVANLISVSSEYFVSIPELQMGHLQDHGKLPAGVVAVCSSVWRNGAGWNSFVSISCVCNSPSYSGQACGAVLSGCDCCGIHFARKLLKPQELFSLARE